MNLHRIQNILYPEAVVITREVFDELLSITRSVEPRGRLVDGWMEGPDSLPRALWSIEGRDYIMHLTEFGDPYSMDMMRENGGHITAATRGQQWYLFRSHVMDSAVRHEPTIR